MSRYSVSTWYAYNVFGADEHYCVGLFRGDKRIDVWSYSTYFSRRRAHDKAERKIVQLRLAYDASLN